MYYINRLSSFEGYFDYWYKPILVLLLFLK
jgi:hypothetical protein